MLRSHKARQAEQRLKIGEVWESSGLVFTDELGHHLAIHTVYYGHVTDQMKQESAARTESYIKDVLNL